MDDGVLENEERFFLNLGSLSPLVAVEEGLGTQTLFISDNEGKISHSKCSHNSRTLDAGNNSGAK